MFFVIGTMIGVAVNLYQVFSGLVSDFEALSYSSLLPGSITTAIYIEIIAYLFILVTTVLQIMFLIQVFGRKPLFLKFEQLSYFSLGISSILNVIALSMIGSEFIEGYQTGAAIGSVIGTVIGLTLMTLYYCKSIRVRTYMGSDEYMRKAIFSFKQPPLESINRY